MKRSVICYLFIFSFPLISCSGLNHKTNFFVDGKFASLGDVVEYILDITSINEDEYLRANGSNVICDEVLKKQGKTSCYFSIELNYKNETAYSFTNLRPRNATSPEPITYIDDEGNKIAPLITPTSNVDLGPFYWLNINDKSILFGRRV